MNSWADDDPEVQEVIAENGGRFRYRGGRWYGGINPRTGHWDLRVSADPADALRLSQRVMEKKMERQRREMEEQMRQMEEEAAAAEEAPAGAPAAGGRAAAGRRLGQWGMGVATGFGAHVATMVAAGTLALTPVLSEAISAAVQPLGATGHASAQVGMSLLQFLANSIRSVSRIGGTIVGVALYSVLGPAFGIAFGFITAELGALLGNFGQALGQALRGVRGVFEDINRIGRETADVIMQIAYSAGLAADAATRLTMGLQAAGVPLRTIGQLFGRWEARPEIMGVRLAAFGLDYGRLMRGDLTQAAAWAQGLPDLLRVPMLRAAFGPAADQLLPVLMRPLSELREAQRLQERWLPSPEAIERVQQRLEAMQSRVQLLGRSLRLHLLEGFLPIMEQGLRTLLNLWDQNRDAVIRFATQTAPRAFIDALQRGVDWLRRHWPEIVQGARDFRDVIRETLGFIRRAWDWLRGIGNALRSIWQGIRDFFESLPDWLKRLLGGREGAGGGGRAGGWGGEPTATVGLSPAAAGPHGPVYAGWQGLQGLLTVGGTALLGGWLLRGLSAWRAAGAPGTAAVAEAPFAAPLLRLFTGMGRGELLYEVPALLRAGPAVAGTAGWLAMIPGVAEWYAAGLEGRQQGDWAFLATMLGGAQLGWRYGGPVGALIGLGIGTFAGPIAERLGARRRRAIEELEVAGMEALVRATQENEELRAAWQALPHSQRSRWLQAIGRAGTEAERQAVFQQMIREAEGLRKADDVFNRLDRVLDGLRDAIEQQGRREPRLKAEIEATVRPVVSPDFLMQLEAQITRRQIEVTWREAQQEMS